MAKNYRVAVIAGDGIGREVVPEGIAALEAAARRYGFGFEWHEFDWSCETYAKTGRMMPEDGLDQLRPFDAVFLGAVGYPGVPDHVSLWGLLIPLRRELPAIHQPAPGAAAGRGRVAAEGPRARRHRFLCRAREQRGRILRRSAAGSTRAPNTRWRCSRRCSRGAAATASCATPSSWRAPARSTSPRRPSRTASSTRCRTGTSASRRSPRDYPDVKTDQYHIDILTAHFVRHPDWFDVVVGSNLFGDILSDLGPAVVGSIGIAPSGQHQPRARVPVDVRAGARLGAGHRRARHRQPDRPDLVGRDDARPFRRERGGRRRSSARSPRCWPKAAPAPPISAATPAPRISAPRSPRRSAEPGSRPSHSGSVAKRRASASKVQNPHDPRTVRLHPVREARCTRVVRRRGPAQLHAAGSSSGGGEHVSIESTGRRRRYLGASNPVAVGVHRHGAEPGRKGGLARLQTRHRSVLQPGPAGRRSHQGLHEREHAGPFRPVQGSPFPGLAASMKRQGAGRSSPFFGRRLTEPRVQAARRHACTCVPSRSGAFVEGS